MLGRHTLLALIVCQKLARVWLKINPLAGKYLGFLSKHMTHLWAAFDMSPQLSKKGSGGLAGQSSTATICLGPWRVPS